MMAPRLALAFLAAAALAGCTDVAQQTVEQRYPAKVQPETVTLAAPFTGLADPFAGPLKDRFDTLVSGYLASGHGPIVLSARPTPYGVRQVQRISGRLIAEGVPKSDIDVELPNEGDAGTVTLSYQRFDLVAPACPGWSIPMDRNFANYADPGMGCAQWHNAAVMAADPADLVAPQPIGSEDAAVISRVDSNYEQGHATESTKNAIQAEHDSSAAVAVAPQQNPANGTGPSTPTPSTPGGTTPAP